MSISDAEGGRSRRAGRAGRVAGMADFHETWGIPMVPKITIEHGFKSMMLTPFIGGQVIAVSSIPQLC